MLVAVAAATIIRSFTELPTPSYEKPLEVQVEAINEQNEDMYWATFDEVEEAKSMEVDVTYKDDASKEKTESVPFATVKIDGEWYAAMPRAALI